MRQRDLRPELMDDPALPESEHRAALAGLARLNRLAAAADPLWSVIEPLARGAAAAGEPPLSVLDVATGSADVPIALAVWAQRQRLELDLRGCDVSDVALAAAAERARDARVQMRLARLDAVGSGLGGPDASVDVVTCSLFLHHLTEEQAVAALREMRRVARRCVVVSDLRRCRAGLAVAWLASRLVTRSHVVRADAAQSVRAAFTIAELRSLASRAGMTDARIRRTRPFRMLMVWSRT